MKNIYNQFYTGEKVKVFFLDNNEPQNFIVYRTSKEELVLTQPSIVLANLFQKSEELIIAHSMNINGIKLQPKEKVKVITKDGFVIELFVDSIINNNSLVLTKDFKRNPSSLKWLFNFLTDKTI